MRTGLLMGVVLCALSRIVLAADCELPADGHFQGDTLLPPGCTWHATVVIDTPLTLDCQGSVFDGEGRLARGLVINSRGAPLDGVVVRNCSFRHFVRQGVLINWGEANDVKLAQYPPDEIRRRSPHNILLSHLRVEANGLAGIVVDDWVQGVVMDHLSVFGNAGWGIYLDHDSGGHLITDSEIRNNGFAHNKPGLAIDASSDNRVVASVFEHNRRAAIELYRNCWEFAASNPHSVPREQGANRNVIAGNRFADEAMGVWVAARQSKDIRSMACGRPYYHEGRYVEDEAQHNLLADNRFERMRGPGIVIEDDDNAVLGNRFAQRRDALRIGTPVRAAVLGRPVRGTRVEGNAADDGELEPAWLHGSAPVM